MPSRRQAGTILIAAAAGLAAPARVAARGDEDDEGPPNVFISPCGEPFRAATDAPYAVALWFKQADANADGRVDHGEFIADAERFFAKLDIHKQGALGAYDIAVYERRIAPEVLGGHYQVGAIGHRGLKWLAQADRPGEIDPGGSVPPEATPRKDLDETGVGASPYSFFDEPEPVTAADLDLVGYITKANFLKLAEMHFTTLDSGGQGYLTLAKLPKTQVQKQREALRPKHHRA
ncbi:MAG TPA: hypothetical protein VII73_09840 [Caulobacteraceae bacterium]